MIKSQLVSNLTKKFIHLPEKVVDLCVDQIVEAMIGSLAKGRRIEIRDFGCFELRYRAARKAHNPKTGEKVITLPKYKLHFRAGKGLRERVDAGRQQK